MKFPCDTCGKYDHWKRNHNAHGSLRPHVKFFDNPQKQDSFSGSHSGHHDSASSFGQGGKEKPKPKAVSFDMATLTSSAANTGFSDELGPLLDDRAPYYAIGQVELSLIADHIGISPNPTIDAIPQALGSHTHTGSMARMSMPVLHAASWHRLSLRKLQIKGLMFK